MKRNETHQNNKLSKVLASVALKAGANSVNSACRFGYHQNSVPPKMEKFKK